MNTNIQRDFQICISVPLNGKKTKLHEFDDKYRFTSYAVIYVNQGLCSLKCIWSLFKKLQSRKLSKYFWISSGSIEFKVNEELQVVSVSGVCDLS